ncbi:MAG: 50S ribosomal protein L11 [Candidatus Thermoplasmatota archaeon]|nr:50S ribosomal protein L11 [Candidatus Thermoplasmatota archaeon]
MPVTTIEALVEGGKASAGPPIGPALGPLGLNIMKVVGAINEKTGAFKGMKVPVKINVDTNTKDFTITIGTPPTSSLIFSVLGFEKGAQKCKEEVVGDLSIDLLVKIAKMKEDSLLGKNLMNRAKEVLGTCFSMGITCDGKNPREAIADINKGLYDDRLSG